MGNVVKGRPTKISESLKKIALTLASKGSTDLEICEIIGIASATLYEWKKKYPEFAESLKQRKDDYDYELLEHSLVKRARGMTVREIQTKEVDGKIIKTTIDKELPPDTTALALYLRNRNPEHWCRDKINIEQKTDVQFHVGLTPEQIRRIIQEDPINQDVVVEAEFLELDNI